MPLFDLRQRYTALYSVTQRYTASGTQRYTALHSVTHCQVQLCHYNDENNHPYGITNT